MADASDLAAVVEVMDRVHLEYGACDLLISGPFDLSTQDRPVVALTDVEFDDRFPCLLIWLDNNLAVRVLAKCHRDGIPVILANLDTTALQEDAALWRGPLAQSAMSPVRFALVQRAEDKEYLLSAGLSPNSVTVTGVLQGCDLPPGYDASERREISEALIGCPIWFARGVPMDEVDLVLDAYDIACRKARKLVLLLDPMSEEDAPAMAARARNRDMIVHERAVEAVPDATTQVFVTDGEFERGLWYSLATVTYLGGSFSGAPCANPLVSAAVGSALIVGPNVTTNEGALQRMVQAEAVCPVADPSDLGSVVARTLNPETSAQYAHAGWMMIAASAEGIDHAVDLIIGTLEEVGL